MIDKIQYLSKQSHTTLELEYDKLKNDKIPEIANHIDEAKQQGDLSENAEYHQAKEDMAWAQGRLLEIEHLLSNAVIIEEGKTDKKTVSVGDTVLVKFNAKTKEYMIVGPQEADPFAGKISNESPLGNSFIGRTAGDVVEVETPAGKQQYHIVEIK
ncbi:MAG: transcription elongation factor GreA [Candidatus Magasanikbacteria bacterium]|nr:transcription elongation factor GreA [Candidatus Magasanikbacteria bacterium]